MYPQPFPLHRDATIYRARGAPPISLPSSMRPPLNYNQQVNALRGAQHHFVTQPMPTPQHVLPNEQDHIPLQSTSAALVPLMQEQTPNPGVGMIPLWPPAHPRIINDYRYTPVGSSAGSAM